MHVNGYVHKFCCCVDQPLRHIMRDSFRTALRSRVPAHTRALQPVWTLRSIIR